MVYDTIIIGAGIAGCTAAVYAARNRMDFLILTKEFGGQFMESGEVLNYPGIVKTTGAEFSMKMEEQLKFNNVKMNEGEEVTSIAKKGANYVVNTNKGKYETQTVIIATGAHARKLNVPGEEKFAKKGVYYCAICDGPLLARKNVAIIGGGNSALEAVDFMKNIAKKIYIINNSDRFSCHQYLCEKVNIRNVETIMNARTTEIYGKDFAEGIRYEQDGKTKSLEVSGVIIEIGRVPSTDFVKGFLKMDDSGHIKINCKTHTSEPGIFAAGDCASGHEYQYVISAGQGCMALIKAHRYISNKK
jgi:thioredoxin reductase